MECIVHLFCETAQANQWQHVAKLMGMSKVALTFALPSALSCFPNDQNFLGLKREVLLLFGGAFL